MSNAFFRRSSDGFLQNADVLEGMFTGPAPASCQIVAPGPGAIGIGQDDNSIVFAVNRATDTTGWDNYFPSFWTSYDPIRKFDSEMLVHPGTMKFVHRERATEMVAGTSLTIADMPNVWFIDHAPKDGGCFFGSGPINDSKDSLIQAVDIAIRLGFKKILLTGVGLYVPLSEEQEGLIRSYLPDFEHPCIENSLWETAHEVIKVRDKTTTPDGEKVRAFVDELGGLPCKDPYSFGTAGVDFPLRVLMDHHYRQVACWLRQSVRCLNSLGVEIVLEQNGRSRLDGVFRKNSSTTLFKPMPVDYKQTKGKPVRFEPYYRPSPVTLPAGQKG